MASQEVISHSGRIVEVTSECTTVEIISESACASCHASVFCGMSDSKKKIVEVPTTMLGLEPGQEVEVLMKPSMGHKAVWVAYVVPLIVLMAVMGAALALGASEPLSGLLGIGSVALYYLGIWLLRSRLRNEYSFYIKKR